MVVEKRSKSKGAVPKQPKHLFMVSEYSHLISEGIFKNKALSEKLYFLWKLIKVTELLDQFLTVALNKLVAVL